MSVAIAEHALMLSNRVDFEREYNRARLSSDKIREATSEFSHVHESLYVLTFDGQSGYCIRPDGELVFVFSRVKGRGKALVDSAVRMGATHLDCFDGYLTDLYSRHGFERVTSLSNWTPGGPDVVYMARHGHYLDALSKAEA